jgi:hypothetical protein
MAWNKSKDDQERYNRLPRRRENRVAACTREEKENPKRNHLLAGLEGNAMVKLSEKDSQIIAIRVVCDGIWRVRSVHVSPIVAMYKPPFEMRRTKTIFRLRLFDSFW